MEPKDVIDLIGDKLFPAWQQERRHLDRIDRWARWDHDAPHRPKQATAEYRELIARSQAPWGDLIVGSVAQTLYVEGYRRPDAPNDGSGWEVWQANGMDARQVALHRAALTYGIAYLVSLPSVQDFTGEPMPKMRGASPREMIALYEDPVFDEWPYVAMRVRKVKAGWQLTVLDKVAVYEATVAHLGDRPKVDDLVPREHGSGVTPVVRYLNRADLEGRSAGEIEPFIPLLGKIDQTAFDRLVVQRFASWIIRTIAGMDLEKVAKAQDATVEMAKMAMRVEDFLVAADKDTKFGSLPATPLDGFIKAHESDLSALAAVSQTPAFELLGQMANLSAEALAAAKASQTAKSDERKHSFGESHEQAIRLAEHQRGNEEGAADFAAQVRWADTSIRSLAQAVDAYGKAVQMLGVPPQVLLPKIPGFTQQDVDEAKDLMDQADVLGRLVADLDAGETSVGVDR